MKRFLVGTSGAEKLCALGADGRRFGQVESFGALVNDFMSSIFEPEPGEHMITDESDLLDFTPLDSSDTTEIWARIRGLYGIARSDVSSERLIAILAAIQQRRHLR